MIWVFTGNKCEPEGVYLCWVILVMCPALLHSYILHIYSTSVWLCPLSVPFNVIRINLLVWIYIFFSCKWICVIYPTTRLTYLIVFDNVYRLPVFNGSYTIIPIWTSVTTSVLTWCKQSLLKNVHRNDLLKNSYQINTTCVTDFFFLTLTCLMYFIYGVIWLRQCTIINFPLIVKYLRLQLRYSLIWLI